MHHAKAETVQQLTVQLTRERATIQQQVEKALTEQNERLLRESEISQDVMAGTAHQHWQVSKVVSERDQSMQQLALEKHRANSLQNYMAPTCSKRACKGHPVKGIQTMQDSN
eukprot:6016203-Amphidinium_carterae.1